MHVHTHMHFIRLCDSARLFWDEVVFSPTRVTLFIVSVILWHVCFFFHLIKKSPTKIFHLWEGLYYLALNMTNLNQDINPMYVVQWTKWNLLFCISGFSRQQLFPVWIDVCDIMSCGNISLSMFIQTLFWKNSFNVVIGLVVVLDDFIYSSLMLTPSKPILVLRWGSPAHSDIEARVPLIFWPWVPWKALL